MATRSFVLVMVLLAMAMAMAMASTSEQGKCNMDLPPFDSCMPAVTGTMPALPSTTCCTAIKTADLSCLCNAVLNEADIDDLNQEAALMLPKKCGVISAGVSNCRKHARMKALMGSH